jgi:hypothetical protein
MIYTLYSVTLLLTLRFADDTFTIDSGQDLNTVINIEINKIAVWFRANKLAVNINKTKYIIFRMRGKRIDVNVSTVRVYCRMKTKMENHLTKICSPP